MSDRLIKDLDPRLQRLAAKFLTACAARGINAFITTTYRSPVEQDADYAQGRSVAGHIITNAKAGESPHNWHLPDGTPQARAFDFAIKGSNGTLDWDASDPSWLAAISIGEGLGMVSGSTFHSISDTPHMELPNWKSTGDPS